MNTANISRRIVMPHNVSEQADNFVVLSIGEELNQRRRETANEIRDMCKALEAEGVVHFILDFKEIKLCPSIVFGNLLVLGKQLNAKGGKVFLANPSSHIEKVARITGLNNAVTMVHTVEESKEILRG